MIEPFHFRDVANGLTFGLGPAGYDVRIAETVVFRNKLIRWISGDFNLASTVERFNLPYDILMAVVDKSSWARRGLFVQNTVAEPGWRGYLTLELTYHGWRKLRIEAGTPIAQMIFHVLDQPTVAPYVGKYQDQERGAQPARMDP